MSDDLAALRRWEDAGGTWQVLVRTPDSVTLSLCTCTGGEEADRLRSSEEDLIAYVAAGG